MRFVPDGPDIPIKLIRKWRSGEVLILAGAGVSVPSDLPLFEGLSLNVYEQLNDRLLETLTDALACSDREGRTKILDAADLSPERRVEADLLLDKQFDRLFSALEKRVDPDLKGRAKTRRVRSAIEAILGGKTHSTSHKDLLRLSTAAPVDPSARSVCRIATTNFDLLFESAWRDEFGREAKSYDARVAPRPGAHNFEGVVHLHGMLSSDPAGQGEYILSSRDFARVYLRSGVIGNYVYDLVRRYTVLLIGYSADDPPMRYLMDAIGEDASLFDDMNQPYAIAGQRANAKDPSGAIAEAVWRAKEIEPILFELRPGSNPYDPLWETLHLWADWSRQNMVWIERHLQEKTRDAYEHASPFARSLIQDVLSILDPDEFESAVSFLKLVRLILAGLRRFRRRSTRLVRTRIEGA